MTGLEAYADLRQFGRPVLTTDDAALRLRLSPSATTHILSRMATAGLVLKLRRGLWSFELKLDPLQLPEYLARPYPAYVSLHSALWLHGLIEQVPRVIYVATLGQTRRIKTALGTYSLHQLTPGFFGGYTSVSQTLHVATPEKALIDTLYLSSARSRLFARLPEVELPESFQMKEARRWIRRIPAASRRSMVEVRFAALLQSARHS